MRLNVIQTGQRTIVYVAMVCLGVIYFFPLYWMVISAFKSSAEISQWRPTFFPKAFTVAAFVDIWETFTFEIWFFNSVIVVIGVTTLTLFFSSLAAFAFAYYDFPGKTFFFMYILSTLMVPMHIRMIPTFLLIKELGWLETYQGLIIPQAATLCGIGVFLLRQFYVAIPRDLIDAARIDGCNEFQIYLKVGLPLIKPALIALGVYVFIASWNNFIWPLLVVQTQQMKTLPLGLVSIMDIHMPGSGVGWPQRMAAATLVFLPTLLLYSLFRNLFIKGITITGIKG